MSAYVPLIKPPAAVVCGDDWYQTESLKMTVVEDEEAPRYTGLLDANGTPLYRTRTREPIGFAR